MSFILRRLVETRIQYLLMFSVLHEIDVIEPSFEPFTFEIFIKSHCPFDLHEINKLAGAKRNAAESGNPAIYRSALPYIRLATCKRQTGFCSARCESRVIGHLVPVVIVLNRQGSPFLRLYGVHHTKDLIPTLLQEGDAAIIQ